MTDAMSFTIMESVSGAMAAMTASVAAAVFVINF
jgi:hypothetical protein